MSEKDHEEDETKDSAVDLRRKKFDIPADLKTYPIDFTRLSKRTVGLLKSRKFTILGDLDGVTAQHLLREANFGSKSLQELFSEIERQCGGKLSKKERFAFELPAGFATYPRLFGDLIEAWNVIDKAPETFSEFITAPHFPTFCDSDLRDEYERLLSCSKNGGFDQAISGAVTDIIDRTWKGIYLCIEDEKYLSTLITEETTIWMTCQRLCQVMLSNRSVPPAIARISAELELLLRLGASAYYSGFGTPSGPCSLLESESSNLEGIFASIGAENQTAKEVILWRYLVKRNSQKTLEAVAKPYGLTRERIRQIEKKALERLATLIRMLAARQLGVLKYLFQKQSGLISFRQLERNLYFDNFFRSEDRDAVFYLGLLAIGLDRGVDFTDQFAVDHAARDKLATFRQDLKKVLSLSEKLLFPLDELVIQTGATSHQAEFLCLEEFDCSVEDGIVINSLAKSASLRKRIFAILEVAGKPLTAVEIQEAVKTKYGDTEGLTTRNIVAACNTLPDILILDWGVYSHASRRQYSPTQVREWCEKSAQVIQKERRICSLNELHGKLAGQPGTETLTPLLLGQLLVSDARFVKLGKLRIGLREFHSEGTDETLVEMAKAFLVDQGHPVEFDKVRDYLLREKGYSQHTVGQFLQNHRELFDFSGDRIGLFEQIGIEKALVEKTVDEASNILRSARYHLLGLKLILSSIKGAALKDEVFLGSCLRKQSGMKIDRRRLFAWVDGAIESPPLSAVIHNWLQQDDIKEVTPSQVAAFLTALGVALPTPTLYSILASASFLAGSGDGRYSVISG